MSPILSGVGGWAGAIVSGDLDKRDGTAALGFVNAMKDLPDATDQGRRALCLQLALVSAAMLIVGTPSPLMGEGGPRVTRGPDEGDTALAPPRPARLRRATLSQEGERGRLHRHIRLALIAFSAGVALAVSTNTLSARELRVCADPNNRPFSAEDGSGMENKIAELIGQELGADVTYTWFAQRRGFLRNTLNAGKCDLVPGIPARMEMLRTTQPYYRSAYMFVRRETTPKIEFLTTPH